jgi:Holliday junction resolvase RusA-like endonuclease
MIQFEIHGDPIPQKQTRFARGRAYNPSAKEAQSILWQIKPYAPSSPLTCSVRVDLHFFFEPIKSVSRTLRTQMLNGVVHHIKKPDVDNLAYLITNIMKGVFYADDAQIVDLRMTKRYHESAHTLVRIIPIDSFQPTRIDDDLPI